MDIEQVFVSIIYGSTVSNLEIFYKKKFQIPRISILNLWMCAFVVQSICFIHVLKLCFNFSGSEVSCFFQVLTFPRFLVCNCNFEILNLLNLDIDSFYLSIYLFTIYVLELVQLDFMFLKVFMQYTWLRFACFSFCNVMLWMFCFLILHIFKILNKNLIFSLYFRIFAILNALFPILYVLSIYIYYMILYLLQPFFKIPIL